MKCNKYILKSFFVMLAFLTLDVIYADMREEMLFVSRINPIEKVVKSENSDSTFKESSEIKLAFTGLIRFYQLFVSSQSVPTCNFTLSCSRFGTKAIQKYGPFCGILMTSDRLQRCNGFGKTYYDVDFATGLATDYPVEKYFWNSNKTSKCLETDSFSCRK
jgi:uncharacterized protein